MRTLTLALVVLLCAFPTLTSAQDAPTAPDSGFVATAEALHGTWHADFERILAAGEGTEEELAMMRALLGSAQVEVTFGADGSLLMRSQMGGTTESIDGTWSIAVAEGNRLELATVMIEPGADPSTATLRVAFEDADTMSVSEGEQETMWFQRGAAPYATPEEAAAAIAPTPEPVEASERLLTGVWAADFALQIATGDYADEDRAMAMAMLAGAELRLTFGPGGVAAMNGRVMGIESAASGTWEISGLSDNIAHIRTTMTEDGGEPETQTFAITFVNRDAMIMTDQLGEAMPFNRAD